MAHELEPVKGTAPDVPEPGMAPWFQAPELTMRPEWTELRPPYREDSNLERRWSVALMVPRALALGFLWITWTWWRTGIFLATILLILIVFLAR